MPTIVVRAVYPRASAEEVERVVTISTLLTLVVVLIVYTLIEDFVPLFDRQRAAALVAPQESV